jgi:hypothetical protein
MNGRPDIEAAAVVPPACPVANEATGLVCPRCGLRAPGVRCPRCDAVKLLPCAGNCAACRKAAG